MPTSPARPFWRCSGPLRHRSASAGRCPPSGTRASVGRLPMGMDGSDSLASTGHIRPEPSDLYAPRSENLSEPSRPGIGDLAHPDDGYQCSGDAHTALLITNADADLCIRMRRGNSLTSAESGAGSRVRQACGRTQITRSGGHAGDPVAAPIGGDVRAARARH
jgi:hypothetical protein